MTDENIKNYIERYIKIKGLKYEWKDKKSYKYEYENELFNIISNLYIIPNDQDIENIFCTFNQCIGTQDNRLNSYEINEIKSDIKRIVEFKKILNEETNFPIISINPMIIDFEKYKISKNEEFKDRLFIRNGVFEILDVQKNVLELKEVKDNLKNKNKYIKNKIGNAEAFYQDTIKVMLKNDVSKFIRKGDKVKMIVSRKLFMVYWNVSKILKCVPSGLEN